jgi:hypothetical protein
MIIAPGRHPFQVLALQQVRDRCRRLDRLDAAADLAVGVGRGLAHVGDDQVGQLAAPAQQLLAQGSTARARRCGGTARHSGCAARAARTASSTCAAEESGTVATVSPVAGLTSGRASTPVTSCYSPLM